MHRLCPFIGPVQDWVVLVTGKERWYEYAKGDRLFIWHVNANFPSSKSCVSKPSVISTIGTGPKSGE